MPTSPPTTPHASRRRTARGLRAPRAGFTLIEVMMALTILVSLVVIVWGSMSVSFKSRQYMSATFDQFQTLRLSLDRMTRELSMAYITTHANKPQNLPGFAGDAELVEDPDTGLLVADPAATVARAQANASAPPRDNFIETAFVGKSNAVHFSAMAHTRTRADSKVSDQCEISYFVRTSRRRTNDGRLLRELVRREDTSPDDDIESGGVVYTLIDDVERVEFEYWRPGREGDEEDGGRWVDSWDSRNSEFRGTLPRRVKITVTVPKPTTDNPNGRNDSRTFTTQAKIMMVELLDF